MSEEAMLQDIRGEEDEQYTRLMLIKLRKALKKKKKERKEMAQHFV